MDDILWVPELVVNSEVVQWNGKEACGLCFVPCKRGAFQEHCREWGQFCPYHEWMEGTPEVPLTRKTIRRVCDLCGYSTTKLERALRHCEKHFEREPLDGAGSGMDLRLYRGVRG